MKTKEELNAIKEEAEILNKKLAKLSEEELEYVTAGSSSLDKDAIKELLDHESQKEQLPSVNQDSQKKEIIIP